MIGTIHTVHTVHTAAPPDPLRAAALDPVGTAGPAPVGAVLGPVGAALDPVAFGSGPVGIALRTASTTRTRRSLLRLLVRVVCAVRTLRTVHARLTLCSVRGL
ncbi:hypothetical protein [Streptomyces sp. NPDC012510]|uniref:hypothetical protein n=1 Tax=Streptomyces sp. NPDC012510 TaxID=3364838 RepID=UPI0036E9C9FD